MVIVTLELDQAGWVVSKIFQASKTMFEAYLIFISNNFLKHWLEAIIPIPKPGKDHSNPINYHPIALTSCIYETREKMVNARLIWYLEKQADSDEIKVPMTN